MAIVVSIGCQKGGIGKTSITCIMAYLLGKQGKKVLVGDCDTNGNATYILTQESVYKFTDNTMLQALENENAKPYIIPSVYENVSVIPAEDLLVLFSRYLYMDYLKTHPYKEIHMVMRRTLAPVLQDYDYILLDLAPNLGDVTLNALGASDYALPVCLPEPLCYEAIARYIDTIDFMKEESPAAKNLEIIGILIGMTDNCAVDDAILNQIKTDYGDTVFSSVIKRRTKIKEMSAPSIGINENTKPYRDALEMYKEFVKEFESRVKKQNH